MKVLITGGNGRAGSYVVKEFLDYGYEVINADLSSPNFVEPTDKKNENLSYRKIDFTDFGQTLSSMEGCEAVVHLAAIPNPLTLPSHEVFRINMMSTYNILESAFLLNISKMLGLKCKIICSDVNSLKIDSNYIVCRAFRKLPHILNISRENCVKKHKIVIMKGKNAQEEINNTSKMRNYEYRLENSITDNDSKIIIMNAK